MSDDDLDLLDTSVLIDALARRFPDGLVLSANRVMSENDSQTHVFYRKGPAVALGLLRYADALLADEIVKSSKRVP